MRGKCTVGMTVDREGDLGRGKLDKKIPQVMERVRNAAAAIRSRLDVEAVYLFGSQAKRTGWSWSDIDIGVFLSSFGNAPLRERIRVIVDMQREYGDDLEFHFFDASNPKNRESVSFAAEVLKTGVRVDREGVWGEEKTN